jgi:hypothetical protein
LLSGTAETFCPFILLLIRGLHSIGNISALIPITILFRWKDAQDQKVATDLDNQQTDDKHLELICKYMDVVKMDLRRVKKTTPVGTEFAPSVPQKFLTLGSEPNNNGHASRIFTEIRQHFRWLSTKKSKRKHNRPLFSAAELRQSNCVLTVLLHNFPHQYIDSMLDNYIAGKLKFFKIKEIFSQKFWISYKKALASNSLLN